MGNCYTWLIGTVTNQEPRKTIGYCFENNRLYCFPNPRWRLEKSDQSGGELRIQDGGSGSHQSQRRTGIGLTDFPWRHKSRQGFRKNVTQLQNPRD